VNRKRLMALLGFRNRQTGKTAVNSVDRVALGSAVVASVWFALATAWGIAGPLDTGHYAAMGGMGVAAENMLKWHIFGPVLSYAAHPPQPSEYYCHHPFGVFWILVPFVAVFGHHDWVLRMPALLMSSLTPPLLYGIGKHIGGSVAGAAAACSFVVIPIAVGFANFSSLEVMVIFGVTLFFWGYAQLMATRRQRYLVASLVGVAFATAGDWAGFLAVGALLGVGLVRVYVLPARWSPTSPSQAYARWWALSASLSVALLVLWVGFFVRSEKLAEVLGSASGRVGGDAPLDVVLASRKEWIDVSFTPLVIWLGKLAAPVALLRFLIRRRDEEAFSLAMLVAATIQYVTFKQGADIHIFWSQYFAPYFGMAFAQLVATWGDLIRGFGNLSNMKRGSALAHWSQVAITLVFTAALVPDAMRALRYGRETGGRFNEHGLPLRSETNLIYLLDRLRNRLPPGSAPDVFASQLAWLWNYEWTSRADGRTVSGLPAERADPLDLHPIFVARVIGLTVEQQKALISKFHVEVYDDEFWVVDRREPHAPLDAYSLQEHEPSIWQWYFICGYEPIRSYVLDPFATWEWRAHLGQPASPPVDVPKTREQIRIAHNVAVAAGDSARASDLRARLSEGMVRVAADFTQGLSLLGFFRIGGTEPRIALLLAAEHPLGFDVTFSVHGVVEKRKLLSLIPPESSVREVAVPAGISSKLYRSGFLYSHIVVLRQRIGVERFSGAFQSRDAGAPPVRIDGAPETPLLVAN